jgi:predicted XRE-type DNA-binding protein
MAEITHENSSGNTFADLGFSRAEAENLTAKCVLILAMKEIIAARALTHRAAAKVCDTDQPTLSKVLHGRMESVTIDRLANWLTNLGQDIEIAIRPAPKTRHGRLHVAAATCKGPRSTTLRL